MKRGKGHYGAGSIDKSGENSWRLRYRIDGKRYNKVIEGTKTEAAKELRRLLSNADDGNHIAPSKLKFSQWNDQWLALLERRVDAKDSDDKKRKRKRGQVNARTLERYDDMMRVHIIPTLGDRPLQKITTTEIDNLYINREQVLAPATMGLLHVILKSCLATAVRKGLLSSNPVDGADPPAPEDDVLEDGVEIDTEQEIGVVLDEQELERLVQAFKSTSLYAIVAVAAYSGMRRNEILALRWVDVDLDAGTISITRSVEDTKRHGRRIKTPKSRRGIRKITIDSGLVALLRKERERAARLVAGVPAAAQVDLSLIRLPDSALIFPALPGTDPAAIRNPRSITAMFGRLALRFGFPDALRFHDLRASHETALLDRGVPVHTVAKRCGHSPAMLLQRYAKRTKKSDASAANVIGTLRKGGL